MQQLIVPHKLSWLFFLVYLLLAGSSCADYTSDIQTTDDDSTKPVCTEDTQCPQDQVCRRNYCTLADIQPVNLGLTFIPPHSTNYLPQRVAPFDVNPNVSLQIGLEASILVLGQLNYQDSALPGPSGLLSIQRSDDPSGFHSQQTRVESGHFEIFLLPGQYTLSLFPDETSIPGFIWHNEVFASDTDFKRTLPNPRSTLSVQGNISFQAGTTDTSRDVPVEKVRVMAISKTGLSSTTTTTDEFGHYSLEVWPNTGSYDLHISPTYSNSLTPSVVIRDAFTAHDQTVLAPQTLGTYQNAIIPAQIRLHPESTDKHPQLDPSTRLDWSQTSVLLHANIGQGVLKLTPDISSEGYIDLKALEGEYTIEIIPPLDSPYARTTITHALTPSENVVDINIPLKKNIRGLIYDAEGNALENVKIRLTPQSPDNSSTRSRSEARTITTTTDAQGQFDAWLENTTYLLSAIPPANSGLPRTFATIQTADFSADTDEIAITIPRPVLIYGTLYEENGREVLPNVSVQGFALINGQQRVIAEALTNARGEFLLITSRNLTPANNQQTLSPPPAH